MFVLYPAALRTLFSYLDCTFLRRYVQKLRWDSVEKRPHLCSLKYKLGIFDLARNLQNFYNSILNCLNPSVVAPGLWDLSTLFLDADFVQFKQKGRKRLHKFARNNNMHTNGLHAQECVRVNTNYNCEDDTKKELALVTRDTKQI